MSRTVNYGFIDIHMHGSAGIDVGTCDENGLLYLSGVLASHGEIGFLPTIPACKANMCKRQLKVIEACMKETKSISEKKGRVTACRVLGAHLEGPFMLSKYKGALDEEAFCDATLENWKDLTGEFEHVVKRVTIDPLVKGAMELIPYLVSKGITVSLGHTAADSTVIQEGFRAGATSVTHIFNAMPSLHHRAPGPVGAALADDDTYAELILDFLHVSREAARLVMKAKGFDRVAVITDACEAAGMPDGEYMLGKDRILVIDHEARKPEGQLASSTVFMDQEYKNILSLGFTPENAMSMLFENQARLLRCKDDFKGYFLQLDDNNNIVGVYNERKGQ